MMKVALAVVMTILAARHATAQDGSFPGLKRVIDPAVYEQTGLQTLSPEQRAALDSAIGDYIAGRETEVAATAAAQAVDVAVKERKVRPPDVIQSKIVGDYTGYGSRTLFRLANGQTWKPTNDDVVRHSALPSPSVVIFRNDIFGYKMFIEGASVVRVKRVK